MSHLKVGDLFELVEYGSLYIVLEDIGEDRVKVLRIWPKLENPVFTMLNKSSRYYTKRVLVG